MKKFTLILLLFIGTTKLVSAQATSELNFGLIGISYDIPVATNFAIAPMARTNFDISYLTLGVKGDFYFDNLIGLPAEWDFYAGVNGGYRIWFYNEHANSSNFDIGLEVGGRWFWSDKWGLMLELSGGVGYGGMLGLTMRM